MVEGLDTSDKEQFRGYLLVRSRYDLPTGSPPYRDFYSRASDGSVTLPAAGYDYGVNWATCTGGTFTRWNGC